MNSTLLIAKRYRTSCYIMTWFTTRTAQACFLGLQFYTGRDLALFATLVLDLGGFRTTNGSPLGSTTIPACSVEDECSPALDFFERFVGRCSVGPVSVGPEVCPVGCAGCVTGTEVFNQFSLADFTC
jgi:hypothetical protein